MTDRIAMIAQLHALATEAAQRGEDRAAATLLAATQMLYEDGVAAAALERRRASDADRQERRRRKEQNHHGNNVTSRDKRDAPEVPPDPLLTPKTDTHTTPRVRELTAGLEDAMGEYWPSASRFLSRRALETWPGWIRGMLKEIGPGSQFIVADLARVCDDDEALTDPIGSPFGLRRFLGKAREERMERQQTGGVAIPKKQGIGARAYHTTLEALEDVP